MIALLLALQAGMPQAAGRAPKLPPPPPPPPNILILLADDLGVDQVGCYAVDYPQLAEQPCTPNIDALAATGMRFTNAWSNPNCSPTRAAIQTGRLARRTGLGTITGSLSVPGSGVGLQLDQPSLAKLLPHYSNAALGKWHLSDWSFAAAGVQHPIELGYQEYAGGLAGIDGTYSDWTKTILPAGIELAHHDVYATVDTTEDALARIASLPEPWLLYVAFDAAHAPYHCPTDQGFPVPVMPLGVCATNWCSDCPDLLGNPPNSGYLPQVMQARALAHALDHEIGRLLAAIDPLDTAVFLASDNGSEGVTLVPPFSPLRDKGTVYQGGVNVPLIVAVPGGAQGECHQLVQMNDLYSTVADLAGISAPPDPLRDSVSLLQYVDPPHAPPGLAPRTHLYTEVFGPNFAPQPGGLPPPEYSAALHNRAVRNATHKLVENRWSDHTDSACEIRLEFYQLAYQPLQNPAFGPDPHEQNDLMLDPSSWSPETLQAFTELSELLIEVYPPLPVGDCP